MGSKETPEKKIKRLEDELKDTRERFRDYRARTRFVWGEMSLFRELLRQGYAQKLPDEIARKLTSNPLHSARPYDDGMVWTVTFPEQTITFDKALLELANQEPDA